MTGTWMQLMAQGWIMTDLTDKALMLGMVNFASGMPMLLLTLAGGSVADRYDKRKILLITQVAQIALAVLLGWLVYTHGIAIWHIIAVAVVLGISTSFEMPAASALVPELVSKPEIGAAVAVDRSVFHATRLIGPAVGGLAIGWWGVSSAFFLNALSFFALIAALLSIAPRQIGTPEEEAKRSGGIKDGFAYIFKDKFLLRLIGLMALTTVFIFPVIAVMLPLYARHALGLKAANMGLLMALSGVGPLTGSIGLLSIANDKRGTAMVAGVGGACAGLSGLAIAASLWFAASSLIVLGISISTLVGLSNIIIQERAPDHLRGRISAIAGMSFFGLMPDRGAGGHRTG